MGDQVKNMQDEEQLKKDKQFEAAVGLTNFYESGDAFRATVIRLAKSIVDGRAIHRDIKENLHRKVSTKDLAVGKDQFYELFNVQAGERLSDEVIEQRRQLTEKAIDLNIDIATNRIKATPDLSGIKLTGSTQRWLNYFFNNPSARDPKENLRTIQQLYGLDENNQPLDIVEEDFEKTRIQILKDRLNEYKAIADSLEGIEFTDERIIENFQKLSELGIGIGMEGINILKTYKDWGIKLDQETLNLANELNEKAYYYNNVILERVPYIQSPHYRYGAEDHLYDLSLMSKTDDPMLIKTIMAVSTIEVTRVDDLSNAFFKGINVSKEDLDFVYDDKGNEIRNNPEQIANALKNSKYLMVFKKGSSEPVFANMGNIMKMPPEIIKEELTPALRQEARAARLDHKAALINKSKLSDARKEFELDIIGGEFEMQTIAASLKTAPDDMKAEYESSLKDSLAKYLAKVAIQKKLDSVHIDELTEKQLISDETINAFVKDFKNSELLNRVYNEFALKDGGLEAADGNELFNSLVKNQKALNEEQMARQKEIAKAKEAQRNASIERVKVTVKALNVNSLVDSRHWGISNKDKDEAKIGTNMKNFTLDRNSLPTIALAIMLDKGYGVEAVMSQAPGYVELRKQCAAEAKDLVLQNRAHDIAEKLVAASEKVNEYLRPYFINARKIDHNEYLGEKYEDVRCLMTATKDLFQEASTAVETLKKQNEEFIHKHPTQAVPNEYMLINPDKLKAVGDEIEHYTAINMMCTSSLNKAIYGLQRGHNIAVTAQAIGDYAIARCKQITINKALKDNPDKNILQVMGTEDMQMNLRIKCFMVATDPSMTKILETAKADPVFANKLVFAMLDGSVFNEDNFKLDINEQGEYKFNIDADKIIKDVNARYLTGLGADKDKKMDDPSKKIEAVNGPKGPNI